jgi:hypothetical protein
MGLARRFTCGQAAFQETDMSISRKLLCIAYAAIAVVALVGTWGNNVHYFSLGLGLMGTNVHFWQETLVNPASRSITVDILFLGLAAIVWMLLEARRISMRWAWVYVLAGLFIAISAAFPAFLIHRERVLAARDGSATAGRLTVRDVVGLVALSVAMLAYTFVALTGQAS